MAVQDTREGKTTRNQDEIRRWIESRDGRPAVVRGSEGKKGRGILRVDFPGGAGEDDLEPISWEEFFNEFENSQLSFLYQEETKDGGLSRFCKFVRRGDSSSSPH